MKADVLMRRIAARGRHPEILGHTPTLLDGTRGWLIATDGTCALMQKIAGAWQAPYAPSNMTEVLFRNPTELVNVETRALRQWAGEPPIPVVMPCPQGSGIGREHMGEVGPNCFHDCRWIEGLGFACEGESLFWKPGLIAGIAVDRVRLAELLQCFLDVQVWYGSDGRHLHVRSDELRLVLCKAADYVINEISEPAFGVAS